VNNKKMYEVLSNMEYNEIIFQIASIFRHEAGAETLIMLTYLVRYDLDFIESCEDANKFEDHVLTTAKVQGDYAGMEYYEYNFLDPDHDDFIPADDGLSWVGFADAWEALKKIATENEQCLYCGGNCPRDEEHACDSYLGDIDGLYKDEE
jgi:hypothetical protein